MPTPLSFRSEDDLVEMLRPVAWERRIDEIHADRKEDLGVLSAVYTSVSSSTFRPFRTYRDSRPSILFRGHVSRELFKRGFSGLCAIRSNNAYRSWALRLARHLEGKWREDLKS